MSWPTIESNAPASLLLEGDMAFARFGTDDILPDAPAYVILDAEQEPKQTTDEYNQGQGLQCGRAQMIHGAKWTLTVRDRTDVVKPQIGDTWRIADLAGLIGSVGSLLSARVMNNPYSVSMGKPGQFKLDVEYVTLIEGA